jgi:LacI family transcriptional regulator, repressor for deo operon, udp, cdd, tsx, nupC, and nupG
MTTIIDVARRASVSTATVSRVLSQTGIVSESTRERVMRAVTELAYQPNQAARSLRTLRASKLLLTVPDISNPFFASVIRGAEETARVADYSIVIGDTRHDPALENQYAAMLHRREVDGLIFLGHRLPESVAQLISSSAELAPIVNGCEYSPGLGVSSVHIDNAAAAADAMSHLLELNHRAIGIITGSLLSPISRDRLEGVTRSAAEVGVSGQLQVRHGDFSVQAGFQQTQSLIAAGVTAIFCFSDEMAIGALAAVREAGLSCPSDVSVIGFDDIRFASFLTPALTTIAQPTDEIGRTAVELLLRTIAGELLAPESITLPHSLVIRGSTSTRR